MLKTTLLTLTALVSAVLAGSVNITSPQQGEVWEAGKEVDIVWYDFHLIIRCNPSIFLIYRHSIGMLPQLEKAQSLLCWRLAPLKH